MSKSDIIFGIAFFRLLFACAKFSSYSLHFRSHTLRLAHNGFSHSDFLLWTVVCNRIAFYHCTKHCFIYLFFFFETWKKRTYVHSCVGQHMHRCIKMMIICTNYSRKSVINVLKICRAYTFHLGCCSFRTVLFIIPKMCVCVCVAESFGGVTSTTTTTKSEMIE